MLRKAGALLIILMLLASAPVWGQPQEGLVFELKDPQGDADGPGGYQMPLHETFPTELNRMLDLTGFRVKNLPDKVRFEFEFAEAPNLHQPWGGAGYNFHRIDMYIVTGGEGAKNTFRPGAGVSFRQPWQVNLRIRDWKGSYLIQWQQDADDPRAGLWEDQAEGFQVFVEEKMIVAEISSSLLGQANENWKYYVLVGLQDPYGPDQYREVNQEAGPWTGGGGCDSEFNPNLYDILADTKESQQNQLQWEVGKLAVLEPVGPVTTAERIWGIIKIIGVILLAAGVAALIWLFAKRK